MVSLVSQSIPEVEVVSANATPRFDQHVSLLSLPHVLRLPEPFGSSAPYLRVDPQRCSLWRERMKKTAGLKIGLAWAGNRTHWRDHHRSINPERLLPLLRVAGTSWYSLQMDTGGVLPSALVNAGLVDTTDHIADFADTAALMNELDLIICVDTATAHLAGALCRPVWTLLSLYPDWRWGLNRETTPWYPTMRLFRQSKAGDWETVICHVGEELAAMVSRGTGLTA